MFAVNKVVNTQARQNDKRRANKTDDLCTDVNEPNVQLMQNHN